MGAIDPGTPCRLDDDVGFEGGHAVVCAESVIVNAGSATAKDVLELSDSMKSRTCEKCGVELEEEVMFLGARPKLNAARR